MPKGPQRVVGIDLVATDCSKTIMDIFLSIVSTKSLLSKIVPYVHTSEEG